MSIKKHLIILGGPTASGKTAFAIQLANYFDTDILSCDSRQFYKEMNIGTAKPDTGELTAAKHHFIDSLSIEQNYSVGDFEREALELLDGLFKKKDVVIMTGGSGLFINALCFGLDKFPEVPTGIRASVENDFKEKGIEFLQKELESTDYEYFTNVDLENSHRVMRAIEVIRATGKPFSSFRKGSDKKRSFSPIFLQMHQTRQALYERINTRVDLMVDKGLLAEAKALFPYKDLNALQTVGYSEIMAHLSGEYPLERAIELIKQNSRRYAKRQITWMRRDGFWKHICPPDWKKALSFIELSIQKDISIKRLAFEDMPEQYKVSFNARFQFISLFQNESLIAYLPIETKGHKKLIHAPVSFSEDKEVLFLLEHEGVLLREEIHHK